MNEGWEEGDRAAEPRRKEPEGGGESREDAQLPRGEEGAWAWQWLGHG